MNKEGWKYKTRGSPDHALLTWLFIYSLGSSMWCLIKRNFIHISVSENSSISRWRFLVYTTTCIFTLVFMVRVMVFNATSTIFQLYFSFIVAVSFIGGGNQSTKIKSPTCRKSLTNFITYSVVWRTLRHEWDLNPQRQW